MKVMFCSEAAFCEGCLGVDAAIAQKGSSKARNFRTTKMEWAGKQASWFWMHPHEAIFTFVPEESLATVKEQRPQVLMV